MKRKQPLSPTAFKEIYSKVPRLTVEAIIVVDKKVILSKRQEKSWHGLWHIPGGSVLYKESIEEAVRRIALEELNLSVIPQQLLGYIEYPSEQKERGFGWSVGLAFLCEAEKPFQLSEKHQLFDEIPEKIVQEQEQILNQVLANML